MLKSEILSRALDLSPAEEAVFSLLSGHERMRIAQIVTQTRLPRSTVKDALLRLRGRRLARPVPIGKHEEWKASNTHGLAETFFNIAEYLQTSVETKRKGDETNATRVKLSQETEFVVYAGWRNIITLYERAIVSHAGERVQALQSTQSAQSGLARVSPAGFVPVNEAIKKHKVIMEAAISPSMLALYKPQGQAWVNSMEGRMNAMRIVPDELLDFSGELLIFRNMFLLTHWDEEACVAVHNPSMIALMRQLFTLMYQSGRMFDQNEYLRGLMEK